MHAQRDTRSIKAWTEKWTGATHHRLVRATKKFSVFVYVTLVGGHSYRFGAGTERKCTTEVRGGSLDVRGGEVVAGERVQQRNIETTEGRKRDERGKRKAGARERE